MGLCQGTPLRAEILARGPDRLDEITDAATHALEQRFGSNGIDAPMRAHLFDARR